MSSSIKTPKPWVAVYDLNVTKNSPAGSCILTQLNGMAQTYDITVFSDTIDPELKKLVQWVRVPLPAKPGFLKYIVFHALAPTLSWLHERKRGRRAMFSQTTQGQFIGADICYAHFCHRAYLGNQWKQQKTTGIRRLVRWFGYAYNAYSEQKAFRQAKLVIAPSLGLVNEIVRTYPFLEGRAYQIANPIDLAHYKRPEHFDKPSFRQQHGIPVHAKLLCFIALGDFERKGLRLVFEAMHEAADPNLHIQIVGGNPGEIALFKSHAAKAKVLDRCHFHGFQPDVRPFLWSSDLFVLPSTYETFSLVLFQASVSGLRVVATHLHGFDEFAKQGENAWLVERTSNSIAKGISSAFAESSAPLNVDLIAHDFEERFGSVRFVAQWRGVFDKLAALGINHMGKEA